MAFFGINLAENEVQTACCAVEAIGGPIVPGSLSYRVHLVRGAYCLTSSGPRRLRLFPRALNYIFKLPFRKSSPLPLNERGVFEKPQLGWRVHLLIKLGRISP